MPPRIRPRDGMRKASAFIKELPAKTMTAATEYARVNPKKSIAILILFTLAIVAIIAISI